MLNSYQIVTLIGVLIAIQLCSSAIEEETCHSYGPGAGKHVYPVGAKTGSHQLQFTKAVSEWFINSFHFKKTIQKYIYFSVKFQVSKPAPHFEGTAVINGEFTQLSLADYKGKYVVFFFYPLDL